ncbi:alpha-2-macroglobulin receptor-associated protein-like isoform X2 [Tubulanus polymorphus]|uniref:alpha-2-macroglobulin receptor-associated protein-like isoform X2 n=1 Tax=Tubulanus polymorphus TaxID=672921 RepID=UPI003DA1D252
MVESAKAIMDRYKLYGADGSNYKPPKIMDKNKIPAPVFDPAGDIDGNTDPSLAKLWNKAKRSGFTGPELLDLKQEFVQHQEKIKEYKELYDKLLKVDGISENSVEPSKILDMSFQEIKEKRKSLKQMHHGIKNSLQKLEQITHGQQTESKLEFNEPRVFDLWIQALKSNMTQIELISFKEELKHFEHKIKKHEYMKEKAKLENINLRTKKNEIPPDFPVDSMSRRAEEYKYKLKKIHADLQYRLEKVKHTEL